MSSVARWNEVLRSQASTIDQRLRAIEGILGQGTSASQGVGALIEALESHYGVVRKAAHKALRTLELRGVRMLTALKLTMESARVPMPNTAYLLEHLEAELGRSA